MSFATSNPPHLSADLSAHSSAHSSLPEFALPDNLPADIAALKGLLQDQHQAYAAAIEGIVAEAVKVAVAATRLEAKAEMQRMIEQLILARHRQFGVSSEQLSAQGRLFDEAETLAQSSAESDDLAAIPHAPAPSDQGSQANPKPNRSKRSPLPAELARVDVVHDVPLDQRSCPCCAPMVAIGEDVSEQLDIVPMQIRVLRHIRKRYGCPGSVHAPITAPLPPQPLPKSNASAAFLAMLLTVKFVDGLPLTRFGKVLGRSGVPVPDQTLARWVIGASQVLQPLHNLMRDLLLESPFIHVDETVVQVLKEPNRAPTAQSYMWVQTGGPPDQSVVIYDYDPSRSSEVPVRLLQGSLVLKRRMEKTD